MARPSTSTFATDRWSSAMARAASRGVNRYRQDSPERCGSCAIPGIPSRRNQSSAGSPADACRRRSSPTSSVAPRSAPGSRVRHRTHAPPHGGDLAQPEVGDTRLVAEYLGHADSRPSPATRTSIATSSPTSLGGLSSSPCLERTGDPTRYPARRPLGRRRPPRGRIVGEPWVSPRCSNGRRFESSTTHLRIRAFAADSRSRGH
jgi:hypothetical protein